VLENRIYQELSSAVAGSQEYMAMEKLHELHAERRYDLLVLDTPPSRNALDFLEAPERLRRFVDSRSLQVFLGGNRGGLRLMGRSGTVLFSVLKRVTGVDLLQDLSDFFRAFGDMSQGFRDRAEQVKELLADRRSAFLVVSSPRPESVDEALFFRDRMRESALPFAGAIVNRMHALPRGVSAPDLEEELARRLDRPLAAKLTRNLADYRALADRDRLGVERLTTELGEIPAAVIPAFEDDVHDLGGLARLDRHLFGPPSPYGRTAT
jgi:anion-transporting  ArsA/GET3 family ATPase